MVGGTLVCILLASIRYIAAQDANCDHYQRVDVGQTYYVYNQNYPNKSNPGSQCRWIASAPDQYVLRLDCPEINIPQSQGCTLDRLLLSRSGDPQLSGAETYCGTGSLTAVSTGPNISLGHITSPNSSGGTFMCRLTAQPSTNPGTCSCGYKKQNRIVGGVETGVNEFPMMAGLVDGRIRQIKGGATIISTRYCLTAAHLLRALDQAQTAVVVGEHNINEGDSPATQGIRAAMFIIHPQYNPNNYDYDIGIVGLATPIQFSGLVGPACLPFKFVNTDLSGQYGTFLGWGTQEFGGPTSDVLMKVDVQMISQAQCRQQVPSVTSRQLCTLTPNKDACQDDSGGPLLYTDRSNGLLYSLGIISYGKSCGYGDPGVNTLVPAFLNWIQMVAPDTYCRK